MNHPDTTPRRLGGDAGSATLWMVFCVIMVLAVTGLVYDGNSLVSGREDAANRAEEAARAGTQAVNGNGRYGIDQATVNPALAQAAAEQFMARNGWTGTVTADEETVTVTIIETAHMVILNRFGVADRTVAGTSTSRVQRGHAGY